MALFVVPGTIKELNRATEQQPSLNLLHSGKATSKTNNQDNYLSNETDQMLNLLKLFYLKSALIFTGNHTHISIVLR